MSALDSLDIKLEGIGHALSDNQLVVPMYQRSYAWQTEQIRALFQDIGSAIIERQDEYFLGSIVLTRKAKDILEVVDGQQRLATISIFIAAVRDYFAAKGDEDRAAEIEKNYLFSKKLRTQELLPRLRLNHIDHDFYAKRILSRATLPERAIQPSKESHLRLEHAQKLGLERVKNITEMGSKPEDALFDWLEFVEKQSKVIWVKVPDEANAFTIFETLNDRGLDLAVSDLLKNYLFSLAGDRLSEVQAKWLSVVGLMESIENESIVVTYIRHFWSSKYGLTREKELYQAIKKKVTSKQAAIDFVTELEEGAKNYVALLNSRHEVWVRYGQTARQAIDTFKLYSIEQNRPLLLAILNRFDAAEAVKAMKMLVSLAVRHAITGKTGGGSSESGYSEAGSKINTGTVRDASALKTLLETFNPNDDEFENAFSVSTVTKSPIARYYLQSLERFYLKDSQPELVPNTNQEEVNLEHILPQNPSDLWTMPADQMKKLYKRIGNLTLMSSNANSAVENAAFSEKVKTYKDSKLKLTQELFKFSQWGENEINERQISMAKTARDIWKLKV
jgi:hypothetical protein